MFAVKCLALLCLVAAATTFELGPQDVIFHLFTRTNQQVSEPLLPSVNSIMTSSFSLQKRTIITIHSNGEGVGGNFNAFVVPAHLAAEDVNVIAVDWSRGSGHYTQGVANARQCGEVITQFMNILIDQFSYSADRIRIVGVGLGAHVIRSATAKINGIIQHVIGLDPSFHGWTHSPGALSPVAANVVEVLYTTAGQLGYDWPLGTLNFYANGGSSQPGCATVACSHTYSYVYYAESITQAVNGGNRFVGTKCYDYEAAINSNCTGDRNAIFGGIEVKEFDSGTYLFATNLQRPFARG